MTKTIFDLEAERLEWSIKTFPLSTALSSAKKLQSETKEIIADIENGVRRPEEYADALMCLFDSGARQNPPITPDEIFRAFEKKLEVNKNREWNLNEDLSYSHKQ